MRLLFILFGLLLSQFTNGQQINKTFSYSLVEENYSSINPTWPQIFTTDNIAITQNGMYELHRKNTTSGNFIFPEIKELSNYELVAAFEFAEKSKTQIVGVVLAGQTSTNGGILFEINGNKSYRISKMGNEKKYLTGTEENQGWARDKKVLNNKKNILKIVTYERIYDLYINEQFIYSFTEIEFAKGNLGLFVGPSTHAYCKSFVVKTNPPMNIDSDRDESTVAQEQIAKLKQENKLKQLEIDRLKAMQENDANNISTIKNLENNTASLQKEIEQRDKNITTLKDSLTTLNYFKSTITNGPDGEAISSLSKTLEESRTNLISTKEQLKQTQAILNEYEKNNKTLGEELSNYQNSDSLLKQRIQFLTRQIDWMTKKMMSDSALFKDTLDDGTGFLIENHLQIPELSNNKTKQVAFKKISFRKEDDNIC